VIKINILSYSANYRLAENIAKTAAQRAERAVPKTKVQKR
jgi:hypothetical protein